MEPRLPKSKQWTSIPSEYLKQIKEVFAQNFKQFEGKILPEGRIYPTELLLKVGFLAKGRLLQANFEVSIEYNPKKQNMVQLIYKAIDCVASMAQQYFDAGKDVDFPRDWKEYDVEGQTVFLRYSTLNTELEDKANELLGLSEEDALFNEDESASDSPKKDSELKEIKSKLGLDE